MSVPSAVTNSRIKTKLSDTKIPYMYAFIPGPAQICQDMIAPFRSLMYILDSVTHVDFAAMNFHVPVRVMDKLSTPQIRIGMNG